MDIEEPAGGPLPATVVETEEPDEVDVDLDALAAEHDLPAVDTLTEDSDFTRFMADGVPELLRKAALRKLWRSSPVFAVLDGLNDYDEDFNKIDKLLDVADSVAESRSKTADPIDESAEHEAEEIDDGDDLIDDDTEQVRRQTHTNSDDGETRKTQAQADETSDEIDGGDPSEEA